MIFVNGPNSSKFTNPQYNAKRRGKPPADIVAKHKKWIKIVLRSMPEIFAPADIVEPLRCHMEILRYGQEEQAGSIPTRESIYYHLDQLVKEGEISRINGKRLLYRRVRNDYSQSVNLYLRRIFGGDVPGTYLEIGSRYAVKNGDGLGVITTVAVNPTRRMMFAGAFHTKGRLSRYEGMEEEFDDPLDELVLEHFLRGLIMEFAGSNFHFRKGEYHHITDPERLSTGLISRKEIGLIVRHLRLLHKHKQQGCVLAFHLDLSKLATFLQTQKGKERLRKCILDARPDFRSYLREAGLPDEDEIIDTTGDYPRLLPHVLERSH